MTDAAPTVGDRDGGVSLRLGRRCRLAASIMAAVGAALLLVVALTSWGLISAVVAVIGGALVIGALPLARRAALWTATRQAPLPPAAAPSTAAPSIAAPSAAAVPERPAGSVHAVVGPPRPLSPGRPGSPVKRRLVAVVVPVLVDDGPAPGGGALIVHARADGEALADGDRVRLMPVGRRGPEPADPAPNADGAHRSDTPLTASRFLLTRDSDGQAFLATTRLTDTW